ncbi:MAG: DUF2975 domain-containing protein [Cytophagales bacterium]|nr:MAG: DUF2975 domain-containing protein [Cytophagales bacterium]
MEKRAVLLPEQKQHLHREEEVKIGQQARANALRKADSLLADAPNLYLVITNSGYTASGTVQSQLIFSLPGIVMENWERPSFVQRKQLPQMPNSQPYILAQKPTVELRQPANAEQKLVFDVRSWADLQALPTWLVAAKLPGLLLTIVFLMVSYHLMRLFETMRSQQFFTAEQARRLQVAGLLFVGYGALKLVSGWLELAAGQRYLASQGLKFYWQASLGAALSDEVVWIITGLTLLALGHIFRYGLQLKQENELTI